MEIVAHRFFAIAQNDKQKTNKEPPLFRQNAADATLRQSEAMGHTGVFPIAEQRGEEAGVVFSQKENPLFRQKALVTSRT